MLCLVIFFWQVATLPCREELTTRHDDCHRRKILQQLPFKASTKFFSLGVFKNEFKHVAL